MSLPRLRQAVQRIRRWYSSSASTAAAAPPPPRPLTSDTWSEADFSHHAEETLGSLSDAITDACDAIPAFDAELSQGVLTVRLGADGTYVLNTQTPNRQIWLSSPVSGPYRYYFDADSSEWLCTRDHHRLRDLVARELHTSHGVDVKGE